jgi:hypothetical protein
LFIRIFTQVVVQKGSSSEISGFSEQAEYSEVIELRALEFENRLLFLEKTEKTG